MPYLIDAQRLIAAFKQSHDTAMASLVFGLLDYYLEAGPFAFDPDKISERLLASKFEHVHPHWVAEYQTELERYFLPTPEGWTPRPGVLTIEQSA
jgi:hypothetical protein